MDENRLAEIEYESLYKEIDKHSNRIFAILNLAIVAVTTVLGFAFNLPPGANTAFGGHVPAAAVLFLLPLFIVHLFFWLHRN